MKRTAIIFSVILFAVSAAAQNEGKFIFDDYSVPRPDKSTELTLDDLRITTKYLDLYPEGIPTADREGLEIIYKYYTEDIQGKKDWSGMRKMAVKVISSWDLHRAINKRYIYAVPILKKIAMLYIFTGNELLSDFLRAHLAKLADLPIEFWVHAEIRKYNPQKPKGYIETSYINSTLGFLLAAVKKDMTPEELNAIETAWYEKGHIPALNWLETPNNSNFTAVISNGALYSSKYFNDKRGWDLAVKGLKHYIGVTIEADGSDSEGYSYYSYPAGQMAQAALIMTPEEISEVFGDAAIRHTMSWRVYGHLFEINENGKPGSMRINYADNQYAPGVYGKSDLPSAFSMIVFNDGIAAWIREKYHQTTSLNQMLLEAKFPGKKVKPTSPQDARLPLMRVFDNGDCFIRSSWDDNSIVMAMKAGDGGARIGYAHNRPELNSIAMGAYGEYLIVTSGCASYRSPLRHSYDITTRAANTVTIDGMNQRFHYNSDVKPPFVQGEPHAIVSKRDILDDGSVLLRSDVLDIYHIDMKEAFRAVRYIPKGDFFIVTDRLVPKDGLTHRYDYRLHIFNRDKKTVIVDDKGKIRIERPKADLYIATNFGATAEFKINDGYLHGPSKRDYDPDGPNQGFPGSAKELEWTVNDKVLNAVAVIFPKPAGTFSPKISFKENSVTVNGKTYSIPE